MHIRPFGGIFLSTYNLDILTLRSGGSIGIFHFGIAAVLAVNILVDFRGRDRISHSVGNLFFSRIVLGCFGARRRMIGARRRMIGWLGFDRLLALFVVNEESLEPLKQCIRDHTDNFRKIKGGMFSRSISDYEGTF